MNENEEKESDNLLLLLLLLLLFFITRDVRASLRAPRLISGPSEHSASPADPLNTLQVQ
jgi:hypothetical protein